MTFSRASIPASACVTPQNAISACATINDPLTTHSGHHSHLTTSNIINRSPDSPELPIPVKCIPIKPSKKGNYLSSSMINKNELVHSSVIIQKYPAYHTASRIPTLARKLAKNSYFRSAVLEKCTIAGYQDEPALPIKELNDLKLQIFSLLPQFWANQLEFEQTWTDCTVSIGQLCETYRLKQKDKTIYLLLRGIITSTLGRKILVTSTKSFVGLFYKKYVSL